MTRFITTSLKSNSTDTNLAKIISLEHSLEFIKREDLSINKFLKKNNCSKVFVVKNKVLSLININNEELFFHPGTGLIRSKSLENNKKDLLIETLAISSHDSVLDCTGGLANDSIVISYYLKNGHITTLEKSKELFLVTKYGLKNYTKGSAKLRDSFKRILLINTDYNLFLKNLIESNTNNTDKKIYDSIYFDPMFEKPVKESSGISKLREYSCNELLTKETIEKALIIAKKRVVVKIRNNNYSFIRNMKPSSITGSSGNKVRYAVF